MDGDQITAGYTARNCLLPAQAVGHQGMVFIEISSVNVYTMTPETFPNRRGFVYEE